MNAACMLGQGKNAFQAEIDSACEAIDFMRFNPFYAAQIYADQPFSPTTDCINRVEYRPLEGFVYTITPFNFTAIAVNLNISPVLMGNVTVWKPATTALLSNYYAMKILQEAGVPDGVINFLPGKGSTISKIVMYHPELAGIHFTGSTAVFQSFWKTVGKTLAAPARLAPLARRARRARHRRPVETSFTAAGGGAPSARRPLCHFDPT